MEILVADDSEANQLLAERQLAVLGHSAKVVSNGREAVEALAGCDFALVLMDCQMPEMDGLEAVREVRRREASGTRHTPIVAMTAFATEHDRRACLAAGMDDYISKPVMLEALRDLLARWMMDPGSGAGAPDATLDRENATGPPATMDRAVLARFREELGDAAFFRFLDVYLSELTARRDTVRDAIAANAPDDVARAAHSLGSPSAAVGAVALAGHCRILESLGRSGTVEGASETLARFEAECVGVEEALRRELEQRA